MQVFGDRKWVEIPGCETLELPPLLVNGKHDGRFRGNPEKLERVVGLAANIVESEEMIDDGTLPLASMELEHQRRKMDLALNLVDQYFVFRNQWNWGDSILSWIRQCETTFELNANLRPFLRGDVWPHAGRKSFVDLLKDKQVTADSGSLESAVGMRLTFRQPPPIACFSNQFLLYLNGTVATTAYGTWASMNPDPVSSLPPERFHFNIVTM